MSDDILGIPSAGADATDEPLGGGEVEDVTELPNPEDFDFDAFIEGVRPGRRAVKVVTRADLMAERDQIVYRAEQLGDEDETEAAALLDRFREVTALIEESQRVFVVEARSDARSKAIVEEVGPEPTKNTPEHEAWDDKVMLHRLADAIVVPSNVTVDGLAKLRDAVPSEFVKLWGAFVETMTNPVRGLSADPNFLLRR